jgi:hypothetical protein
MAILDGIMGKDKVYAGHSPAINLAIGGQSGHFNQVGRILIFSKIS